MTGHGPGRDPVIHVELAGALDAEVLESMVRFANSTIRAGCTELVLQLHAVTDFPARLFTELHLLDHTARLHRCRLRLLGLDEAVTAVLANDPDRP